MLVSRTSYCNSRNPYIICIYFNQLASELNSLLVITHYQRLLNYIVPDFVHVTKDGKIIKTGTKKLALELEEKGYDDVIETAKVGV